MTPLSQTPKLDALITFQGQGKAMGPYRVEACRWASNKTKATRLQPHRLNTSPTGWPEHPILELKINETGEHLKGAWVQINPKTQEKKILEEKSWSLDSIVVWPGGNDNENLADFLLAKKGHEKIRGSAERIISHQIALEILARDLGKEVAEAIKKSPAHQKRMKCAFLCNDLPTDPAEKEKALRNRIQFLERFPGVVASAQGITDNLPTRARKAEEPQIPPEENQAGMRFGMSLELTSSFQSQKTKINQDLQRAVDQETPLDELLDQVFGPIPKWMGKKTFCEMGKLLLCPRTQREENTELLNSRIIAMLETLEQCPEENRERVLNQIRRSSLKLQNVLLQFQKEEGQKWIRAKDLSPVTQNYQNIRGRHDYFDSKTNSIERSLEAWQSLLNKFTRAESLAIILIPWALHKRAEKITQALQKNEAKKPEEERHVVHQPDLTHIRDYLQDRYPDGPFPENLAPEKLLDQIRRWDTFTEAKTQELLEAEKKEIPESIRAFYPEIKIEGASVKLLQDSHEFAKEGDKQKHCVAGYFQRASEGYLGIYAIKLEDGSNWTAEISHTLELTQLRGHRNQKAPTELDNKLKKILKNLREEKSKESEKKTPPKGEWAKVPKSIRDQFTLYRPTEPGKLLEAPDQQGKDWIATGKEHSRFYTLSKTQGNCYIEAQDGEVYIHEIRYGRKELFEPHNKRDQEIFHTLQGNQGNYRLKIQTHPTPKSFLISEKMAGQEKPIETLVRFKVHPLEKPLPLQIPKEEEDIKEITKRANEFLGSLFSDKILHSRKKFYEAVYVEATPEEAAEIIQDIAKSKPSSQEVSHLGTILPQRKAELQRSQEIELLQQAETNGKLLLRIQTRKLPEDWVKIAESTPGFPKDSLRRIKNTIEDGTKLEIAGRIPPEARHQKPDGKFIPLEGEAFRWLPAVNTLELWVPDLREKLEPPKPIEITPIDPTPPAARYPRVIGVEEMAF